MIELPECAVIARQYGEAVTGKTIARVSAAKSPHKFAFYHEDPAQYSTLLVGKTIDSAHAFGGRPELVAGQARISFGDGVNIRYLPPGTPEPDKHQLYIAFDDGSALSCTVQMYGCLLAFPDGAVDDFYYRVGQEKPSPLTDAFDEAYFESLLTDAARKLSTKAFLATEQRIPGLGNGVAQDILWRARLHPKRKMSTLTDAEFARLFRMVKDTLREMADAGGRDTERDLYGNPGGYKTVMSKHNALMLCPACGGPVVRTAYLGGNIYFCQHCQTI